MKKILTILFVVAMVVCLTVSLAACGGNDNAGNNGNGNDNNNDGKTTYTVTVTCDDDIVLATVQVKLTTLDDVDVAGFVRLVDGVATFRVDAGTYKVVLSGALDRFDVPNVTVTPLIKDATVALTLHSQGGNQQNEELSVSLTVQDELNRAIANLPLQVCSTGVGATCTSAVTDANGVATLSLKAGEYEVHIEQSNLPENTYFDNNTRIVVSQSSTSFTVHVVDAHTYSIHLETDAGNPVEGITIALRDMTEDSTIVLEMTTDAEGNASVVGPKASWGYSVLLLNCPPNYSYDTRFVDFYDDNVTIVLMERGASTESRILVVEGVETTIYVTEERPYAWIEFDHKNVPGEYKIQSSGSLDTTCKHYQGAGYLVEERGGIDMAVECAVDRQDLSSFNKNFMMEFAIRPEEVGEGNGNIYAFKVGANNVVGTQSFTVKITFLRTIEPTVYEEVSPQAEQVKDPIDAPKDSKFAWVPYGDGYTVDYNEEDGYYHLNGVDGPIIFVPVAGSTYFPRSFDVDFVTAYYESAAIGFVFIEGNYQKNYGEFLQTYAQHANADGLTPLTQELKEFLQTYCLLNGVYANLNWDKNVESDNLYYFACCYYKNLYNEAPLGEGTVEDPYGLVEGAYKFTISADAAYNFVLYSRSMDEYKITIECIVESATLLNSNGEAVDSLSLYAMDTFSVVCEDESATIIIHIQNVLYIPVEAGGFLSVGDQTVYGSNNGVQYSFTAQEDGNYLIFSPDSGSYLYIETAQGVEMIDGPIALQAGQTITFSCGSFAGNVTYIVSIVMV